MRRKFGAGVWAKDWMFALGGRPVIYEPAQDFDLLPESHQWRHLTYETREGFERTDFTWEREWRIRCDYLDFDPNTAQLVVLDQSWAERIVWEYDHDEDYQVAQYGLIFGKEIAEAYRQPFHRLGWRILTLR